MGNFFRKLDNTAKLFSVEEKENYNMFRLSVILKKQVDFKILKLAVKKALDVYPSYRVKIKSGFFLDYLKFNPKEPIVEKEKQMLNKRIKLKYNNDYLFKVTYFDKRINLDVFHVLTDGIGATNFFKCILYNYFNLKYDLKNNVNNVSVVDKINQDEYLKNVDMNLLCKDEYKKAFIIKDKSNLNNKTYHYVLDLEKLKGICRNFNVSITEYLTAIYIYGLYKSVYDKTSDKDIRIAIPIDLRSHYNTQSLSNFFTCMNIKGNVSNNNNVTLNQIIYQVHKEFKNKLTTDNISCYLNRDVKLGTNIIIQLIPLFAKKLFMKYLGKIVNQASTSTLSNIGSVKFEKQYQKYIENFMTMVNAGKVQKIKCTICSYENKLTVTINSNLTKDNFETAFYNLLKKYIGDVKLEKS